MTAKDKIEQLNRNAASELIDAHKNRADEPLILAVRYNLKDTDLYIFEVIGGFPGDDDDPLFETEYEPSPQLRVVGKLHLLLGSPRQLETELGRGKALAKRLKGGVVLFSDGSEDALRFAKMLGL